MSSKTVSNKVSLGTLGGGALGVATSLLVYFIPAWHAGLPGYVALILPVLLTLIGHFGAGYQAKHTATADEIQRAIDNAEALIHLLPHHAPAPIMTHAEAIAASEPAAAPFPETPEPVVTAKPEVTALPPTSEAPPA